MRCLNCHTVLMATDTECPVCHSGPQLRACEMPQPSDGQDPNGMRMLCGIAGGLVGTMLYDAVTGEGSTGSYVRPVAAGGRPRPRGASAARRIFGLLILLVGGLLIAAAVGGLLDKRNAAADRPRTVTAADLRQLDNAAALPGGPVAYTVRKAKPTGLEQVRRRTDRAGEVTAHIVLLQVEDKWLIAAVPPGFSGSRLVGRLERLDTPLSETLIEDIQESEPNPLALLSFQLNAVDGVENDRLTRYVAVGLLAFVGLLGFVQGLRMVGGGSRRAAPYDTGLTVQLPR